MSPKEAIRKFFRKHVGGQDRNLKQDLETARRNVAQNISNRSRQGPAGPNAVQIIPTSQDANIPTFSVPQAQQPLAHLPTARPQAIPYIENSEIGVKWPSATLGDGVVRSVLQNPEWACRSEGSKSAGRLHNPGDDNRAIIPPQPSSTGDFNLKKQQSSRTTGLERKFTTHGEEYEAGTVWSSNEINSLTRPTPLKSVKRSGIRPGQIPEKPLEKKNSPLKVVRWDSDDVFGPLLEDSNFDQMANSPLPSEKGAKEMRKSIESPSNLEGSDIQDLQWPPLRISKVNPKVNSSSLSNYEADDTEAAATTQSDEPDVPAKHMDAYRALTGDRRAGEPDTSGEPFDEASFRRRFAPYMQRYQQGASFDAPYARFLSHESSCSFETDASQRQIDATSVPTAPQIPAIRQGSNNFLYSRETNLSGRFIGDSPSFGETNFSPKSRQHGLPSANSKGRMLDFEQPRTRKFDADIEWSIVAAGIICNCKGAWFMSPDSLCNMIENLHNAHYDDTLQEPVQLSRIGHPTKQNRQSWILHYDIVSCNIALLPEFRFDPKDEVMGARLATEVVEGLLVKQSRHHLLPFRCCHNYPCAEPRSILAYQRSLENAFHVDDPHGGSRRDCK